LFAEVRAQPPREALGKPVGDEAGDVGLDLLGWLLDAGDDVGHGESSD
jgi:hypothetical protein